VVFHGALGPTEHAQLRKALRILADRDPTLLREVRVSGPTLIIWPLRETIATTLDYPAGILYLDSYHLGHWPTQGTAYALARAYFKLRTRRLNPTLSASDLDAAVKHYGTRFSEGFDPEVTHAVVTAMRAI